MKTPAEKICYQLPRLQEKNKNRKLITKTFSLDPVLCFQDCNFDALMGKIENSSLQELSDILSKYADLISKTKATMVSIIC